MASHLDLTSGELDTYLDKPITDICPLGFGEVGDAHNHCAHFVGHVLSLNHDANVGLTCASMTHGGRKRKDEGACIRVNELFNRCTDLEEPDDKGCLAYITMSSNIKKESGVYIMGQQPKKHVGIYLDGHVWHYGNKKDKVTKQKLDEFKQHYKGDTVVRFTAFPKNAKFVSFSQQSVVEK